MLTTRAEALKRGLPILGIFRSFAAVGVDPAVMGIGPAVAIPTAVKMAGLTADDIDLYELNEAFASQVSEAGGLCGPGRTRCGAVCGEWGAGCGVARVFEVSPHLRIFLLIAARACLRRAVVLATPYTAAHFPCAHTLCAASPTHARAPPKYTLNSPITHHLSPQKCHKATYCSNVLGLDSSKVNVNGGAVALGHPLGATGARCTATLLHEMAKRGPACRFGVVSMCIGSGMGAAGVFERGGEVDALTNAAPVRGKQVNLSRDAVL